VDRLAEDHSNARRLAEGLAQIPGIALDPGRVRTNIVYFDLDPGQPAASDLVERMAAAGVRMLPTGAKQIRAVTQYHVGPADIDRALDIVAKTMRRDRRQST
jgi:threonine aldolase